jgi:hypothetical protein
MALRSTSFLPFIFGGRRSERNGDSIDSMEARMPHNLKKGRDLNL